MESTVNGSNLTQVMGLMRRRGIWGVLCVALATAGALAYSRQETKKYTATASIVFNSQQLSQLVAGLQTPLSGQAEQNSNVRLLQVGDMAERTASVLGGGLSATQVQQSVGVSERGETSVVGESSIVEVSATTVSPRQSAAIANTYASTFVAEQQQRNRSYFTGALAIVRRELATLPEIQRNGTVGASLESRVQALSLLANLRYGGVQLAQQATVPSSPSTPNTSRNILIGGFLGLLVGVALMLGLERLDGRLADPEELAALHGAALLGVIPAARKREAAERRRVEVRERFSLILARMYAYNDPHPTRVILASASAGPESEHVAWGLARAAVERGSRALVIELPGPTAARLEPASAVRDPAALEELLASARSPAELIRTVHLHEAGDPEPVTIHAIRAPALPASGAGALPSAACLSRLLEWAGEEYELTLISAPPLTALSDAYPLLEGADGALVVSDTRRARRAQERELAEVMLRSGVSVLGVVTDAQGELSAAGSGQVVHGSEALTLADAQVPAGVSGA